MRSVVLLQLALCLAPLAACQKQDPPPDPPVAVSIIVAHAAADLQEVTATGTVAARTQSDLSFRLGGRVSERLVDIGSHVVKGQVIARIDPEELHAAVSSATAGVDAAESRLRQATVTRDRQKILIAQGFTSRSALDQAEAAYRVAESGLAGARTALETSREQLAQTDLRATADGMITGVSVEAGEVVQPAQSVFTLAEDQGRDAIFNLSERVLLDASLSEGEDVRVRLLASPAIVAEGKIREISPAVDPASGTVRVKVGLHATPPSMMLGSTVGAGVRTPGAERVVVPWQALTSDQRQQALWIVDRNTNRVSLRHVSVERYLNGDVVLASGVSEGETIIVRGSQFLHPQEIVAWAGRE